MRNPAYAGAYTWGRCATDPRRARPGRRGSGRVRRAAAGLSRCSSATTTPRTSAGSNTRANLRRLEQHRRRGPVPGPARATVAVLAGLVVCGECGCRMQTHYTRTLRYVCQRHALDYAAPPCQSLAGAPLEQLVPRPGVGGGDTRRPGIEPACGRRSAERERAALDRQWRLRLERAAQEADRACRQYNAVEPENRLVARTLERHWEEALLAQRSLEEEYRRFQQAQPVQLAAAPESAVAGDALAAAQASHCQDARSPDEAAER